MTEFSLGILKYAYPRKLIYLDVQHWTPANLKSGAFMCKEPEDTCQCWSGICRSQGCAVHVNKRIEKQPEDPTVNASFAQTKSENGVFTYLQRRQL